MGWAGGAREPGCRPGDRSWDGGVGPLFGVRGDVLRCRCGRPAGEKLVTIPADRSAVNVGTGPMSPVVRAGKTQRPLMASGRGGASVVVRGRESRLHGEGRQRACSARLEREE